MCFNAEWNNYVGCRTIPILNHNDSFLITKGHKYTFNVDNIVNHPLLTGHK